MHGTRYTLFYYLLSPLNQIPQNRTIAWFIIHLHNASGSSSIYLLHFWVKITVVFSCGLFEPQHDFNWLLSLFMRIATSTHCTVLVSLRQCCKVSCNC
jgi:hypothetical protein